VAPAPGDAGLNSTCISSAAMVQAAPADAPTQPSPLLRTGEGFVDVGAGGEVAPRAAPRPRRSRMVYWDGSQGPAPAAAAP